MEQINGQYYSGQELIIKTLGHTSNKTGSPGFHGKYNRKTQTNEPTKRDHKYIPITFGPPAHRPHINTTPDPSYGKITAQTVVCTGSGDNTIRHRAEIKDNQVFLNDILIASAPAGKTKVQKEKFCKAIVWSLLNDPITLQDKLSEISGKMPVIPEKIITDDIATIEEITGYPEFKHSLGDEITDQERCDLIAMSYDDYENFEDDHYSDILHTENLKGIISELPLNKPAFPIVVLSWLNLTIQEVPA